MYEDDEWELQRAGLDPDNPACREKITRKIYGEENPFLEYINWLNRHKDRPHLGGIERCFKEWGACFKASELPISERLRHLRNSTPAIHKIYEISGINLSYNLTKQVIEAVDTAEEAGEFDDTSLCYINSYLDNVDPLKYLKRYSKITP